MFLLIYALCGEVQVKREIRDGPQICKERFLLLVRTLNAVIAIAEEMELYYMIQIKPLCFEDVLRSVCIYVITII